MDREYRSEALLRLATSPLAQVPGWREEEVSDLLLLVQCARAARLDTDLRNSRMLGIEPDRSGDPNKALATLRSGRRVDLTFKNNDGHAAVVFDLPADEVDTPR